MGKPRNPNVTRVLDLEASDRMWQMTRARLIAQVVIAVLLQIVVPFPTSLYFHGLLIVLALIGIAQWRLYRAGYTHDWIRFVIVALDFALITFALIYPNPFSGIFSSPYLPPQFALHFANFIYLFVLLVSLAFEFRPILVIWGGVCGSAFWAIGVTWLATLPGATIEPIVPADGHPDVIAQSIVQSMLRPNYVDIGIRLQEVVVFLICAGVLALVVQRSRGLISRQAGLERRQANLSRYFPAETAELLAERDTPFDKTETVEAAVLFTDVVGFSSWAEERPPAEVIARLRLVHAVVAETVFAHGGVLDKFIGDGAMATFGAIQPRPDDARRALDCVSALIAAIDRINEGQSDPIKLAIGLHYGPVVVGDVGTSQRMELAVIGDTVNVANRLEAITRNLHTKAAVSQEVLDAAGTATEGLANHGSHILPGRHLPVTVWTA